MAFAEDYALIGSTYGGSTGSLYNIERRHSSTNREGLDVNFYDDETETDVEFMTMLYRNAHPHYYLGSWIIKPVIEILLHYMGFPRVTSNDQKLADALNECYLTNKSSLQQLFRELGLFGEEYAMLSYDSDFDLPSIKGKNKSFVIETRYEDYNNPDDLTYIRYKEIVSRLKPDVTVTNGAESSEKEQVTFYKTFWKELNPKYTAAAKKGNISDTLEKWNYYYSLSRRDGETGDVKEVMTRKENLWGIMPVQQLHQNRMSNDGTGYSDVNGLIKLTQVYHQVLESMIDTNIYNGKPTMMFTGLTDAEKFIRTTYGEVNPESNSVGVMGSYELFGSYYLEGDANASYLSVDNGYIEGAKEILRLMFYIYVQTSGVPEWALGAHIDGSWASTKMQSTPLMQKIDSKRLDINDAMIHMNVKLAKIIEHHTGKEFKTYFTQLEWPKSLKEDQDYILAALDKVIPLDVLTNEKVLELLDIVADPAAEIEKRQKQKESEQVEQNAAKEELADQLMSKLQQAAANKSETGETDQSDELEQQEQDELEQPAQEMSDKKFDEVLESFLGKEYSSVMDMK